MKEAESVLSKLKELTGHKYARITNCGDSAIFAAMHIAKKTNTKPYILIPDQGGWLSYKTFPEILGFKIKEVKTDYGLIDLEDLEKKAKNCSAFIFSSLAGYFARQDLEKISEICKKHSCLLIEDASGSIGFKGLCNGKLSDIIIGSFGKHKTINLGYSGFISAKQDLLSDNELIRAAKAGNIDYALLNEMLKSIEKRLGFLTSTSKKIKKDLEGLDIIHEGSDGINVLVKFKNNEEKKKITDYCDKNKYEYTLCPRYIRVEEDAVSIEVKRL